MNLEKSCLQFSMLGFSLIGLKFFWTETYNTGTLFLILAMTINIFHLLKFAKPENKEEVKV